MEPITSAEASERFEAALVETIRLREGSEVMVNQWVVVAEFSDVDGRSWILDVGAQDSTVWGRMGLYEFALAGERNRVETDPHEED